MVNLQVAPDPWGKVNWVRIRHYGVDGALKMEQVVKNNRVTMGALWQANTMFGTVSDGTIGCIGLSGTIATPTGTETALIGEIATYGFSRIAATRQNYVAPTVLNGTFTMDIYNQFMHTGTGTSVGIGMAALFNKVAAGTLFALATFTQGPATLSLGERLDVTWTVSA
jgi:hypothetical protein